MANIYYGLSERACSRTWIELDLDALRHNVRTIRSLLQPGTDIIAVVKSDAYGHRASITAPCLEDMGITKFAVAALDEAIELREAGIKGEILILGYTDPLFATELMQYGIAQTVIDRRHGLLLNQAAAALGHKLDVHLKIDTGMHRLGIDARNPEEAAEMLALEYLNYRGIYSHFASTDSIAPDDIAYTRMQAGRFFDLIEKLRSMGVEVPMTHLQNTYGLINYRDIACDCVRVGAMLFGMGNREPQKSSIVHDLRPLISLRSKIATIRTLQKGECFGYGTMFCAQRESRIAVMPLGYWEGMSRKLACGRGEAIVKGIRVPFAGLVCMDQLGLDITDVPGAEPGDIATFIGKDGGEEIEIVHAATAAETLHAEVYCRTGRRTDLVVLNA
jgi:serine/alanine racemase